MDPANTPVLSPPPGVTPNFVNPEDRGGILIITSALCLTLLLPFVVLRFYTRIWITRTFGLDDASCLLATAGVVAYIGVILSSLHLIGRHVWDVPMIALTEQFFQERVLFHQIIYGPIVFFAKASILLLYLRLFFPDRWTRYATYFGLATIFVMYLATSITSGVLCLPRPGELWREAALSPRCEKSLRIAYVRSIFNVVSDFYIWVLPMPIIFQLRLPTQKKIGVCVIFVTGFLACIASALGLHYRIILARTADWTWVEVPVDSLVMAEISMGIVCGCMPYLTSFFKRHPVKSFKIPCLAYLTSSTASTLRKYFGRSKRSSTSDDADPLPRKKYYLDTGILGSVFGKGKFLDSKSHTEKDWLDQTSVGRDSEQDGPIPDAWFV